MNNQSLNPFGPNAASASSSSLNQLFNANMNNNTNRNTPNNHRNANSIPNNHRSSNNNQSNVNSIDFSTMLQSFGLLKQNQQMPSHSQQKPVNTHHSNNRNIPNQTQSDANDANKNLLQNVLGQLSKFNANKNQNMNSINARYNNLFGVNNTKQTRNNNTNNANTLNANLIRNTNNSNNALNNVLSQLSIPQNVINHQSQTNNRLFNNSNSLFDQMNLQSQQRNNSNNAPPNAQNPLFNMKNNVNNLSMNNMNLRNNLNPVTNTSTIGMNLNITSTSHQIPLNIIPQIQHTQNLQSIPQNTPQKPAQPSPLLKKAVQIQHKIAENKPETQKKETVNECKEETKAEKEDIDMGNDNGIEDNHEVSDEDSDKSSIISSSSSNVEQFLGNLNSKKRKQRSSRRDTDEPVHKRRKFDDRDSIGIDDSSDSEHIRFELVEDIECKSLELLEFAETYKKEMVLTFGRECIECEPFIFVKNDMDLLYPHSLCDKLLSYGYDDENDELTQSQLLKMYGTNTGIMNMYKLYINLPSVMPVTLPVIDCNKLLSVPQNVWLDHAFIVRNWDEGTGVFECKFPMHCTYLDLLLNIGGMTDIKVIDNVTNLDISDDMKLYQYIYMLQNTLPAQREYSMNLISLEVSGSILDTFINRPQFVQSRDWISPKRHLWFRNNAFRQYFFSTANNIRGITDNVECMNLYHINDGIKTLRNDGMSGDSDDSDSENECEAMKESYLKTGISDSGFPEIQKYVLISSANSFTQWHIDFNGSCVWYYMCEGYKYFYIITDVTHQLLDKYKQWHTQGKQDIWFPEYAKCQTQLVVLSKNELLILPSGCIHCVYTPVDSIAFGGNFLCDYNIDMQLRIEHLYHTIYANDTVPCCQNFRDLNALKVIEIYYKLKRLQSKRGKSLRDVSGKLWNINGDRDSAKGKQNAIDLCIQILFWAREELRHKKVKRKGATERLCKFDLINVQKLKPRVYECLEMMGIKSKLRVQNEMKRFLKKYRHYKPPKMERKKRGSTAAESEEYNVSDEEESSEEQSESDCEESEDALIDESELNSRQRSLRSAKRQSGKSIRRHRTQKVQNRNRNRNNKGKAKGKSEGRNKRGRHGRHKSKSEWRSNNAKIQCFKCKEKSPVRHMILFICCDTYYHLRCAGYTTSRTQRAIQQHIDNGTINKQCPVCVKKGLKSGKNT